MKRIASTWSRPTAQGQAPRPRCSHASCVIDHKLIVCGGWSSGSRFLDDVHIYSIGTSSQTARFSLCLISMDAGKKILGPFFFGPLRQMEGNKWLKKCQTFISLFDTPLDFPISLVPHFSYPLLGLLLLFHHMHHLKRYSLTKPASLCSSNVNLNRVTNVIM